MKRNYTELRAGSRDDYYIVIHGGRLLHNNMRKPACYIEVVEIFFTEIKR